MHSAVFATIQGNDLSKMSDDDVALLSLDVGEQNPMTQEDLEKAAKILGAVVPFMTQWGWNNSPAYNAAKNKLTQAGTHSDLNGKVPTRQEATRMIEESGGRVDRQDAGHAPGGVSTHMEPHINYYTPNGEKATVIVKE